MSTFEIEVQGANRRIAVVVSRFNHLVVKRLLDACLQRLKDAGCEDVDVFWVPGAVEIPLTAQTAARTGRYDAIVAVGAVIRGETGHYDEVCRVVTEGVRQVALAEEIPVAFGVLTTETLEQAVDLLAERATKGPGKKRAKKKAKKTATKKAPAKAAAKKAATKKKAKKAAKRGPGRPRKAARRGPGRPKKTARRGPGRPRKAAKRGRPRKVVSAASALQDLVGTMKAHERENENLRGTLAKIASLIDRAL